MPEAVTYAEELRQVTRQVNQDLRQRSWRAEEHLRALRASGSPKLAAVEILLLPFLLPRDRMLYRLT